MARLAECFLDGRSQELIEHTIAEMLAQRIYGLALGYEDINDHAEPDGTGGTGINDRYKKITFWKEAVEEAGEAVPGGTRKRSL